MFSSRHNASLWMWIGLLVLAIPNVLLSVLDGLSLVVAAINIIVPAAIYLLLLSVSRNVGRTLVILFPLMFFAAFQIVLLWLFGRSVIAVDMFLNLWTTNPSEAGELLGQIWPAVIIVCVLYLPPLVFGIMLWVKKVRLDDKTLRLARMSGVTAALLGCVLLTGCFVAATPLDLRTDIYPANVGYNIRLAFKNAMMLEDYDRLSADFRFDAVSQRPDSLREVYVLVIGETSRADRWQLNGARRATNPRLSRIAGLVSFPRALSSSNTTHKSVPLMLTHLSANEYGEQIFRTKSLITAFREAGFHTAFISNQRHNHSFIDFFGAEADTTLFLREPDGLNNPEANDLALLDVMDGLLAQTNATKNLIVLHSYGSHFSYADRYAGAIAPTFLPDDYSEASKKQREVLLNAYDNTILLTDSLLSGVITRLQHQPALSAMLYASDHGEDIFDDDRGLFLHASPCPSFYQLHVPFVVWLSEGYRRAYPEQNSAMRANAGRRVTSSSAFFDTALLLGGIATPFADSSQSPLSPGYVEQEWVYLNDHNRAVDPKRAGLQSPDFVEFARLDYVWPLLEDSTPDIAGDVKGRDDVGGVDRAVDER